MFNKFLTLLVTLSILLGACGVLPSETQAAPTNNTQATATPQVDNTMVAEIVNRTLTAMAPLPTQTAVSTSIPPTQTTEVVPAVDAQPVVTTASDWVITWLPGASLDRGDGTTFKQDAEKWTWLKIAPELWPTFPNEPNKLVPEFRVVKCADDPTKDCVPDGLENAMNETNFCQQLAGEDCLVPVAARHYLYFSGDYDIPGIGACAGSGEGGQGCLVVTVNVGDVTTPLTGMFGQGFRIHARYWNGDKLDQAIWALVSHGSNNMLHLDTKLNPTDSANAGANCSVPTGCESVNVRVVFMSGSEILEILTTTVSK